MKRSVIFGVVSLAIVGLLGFVGGRVSNKEVSKVHIAIMEIHRIMLIKKLQIVIHIAINIIILIITQVVVHIAMKEVMRIFVLN